MSTVVAGEDCGISGTEQLGYFLVRDETGQQNDTRVTGSGLVETRAERRIMGETSDDERDVGPRHLREGLEEHVEILVTAQVPERQEDTRLLVQSEAAPDLGTRPARRVNANV